MATSKLKNQKTNNKKKGSETTISNSSTSNRITNIRTTDVQIPKSHVRLRANHFNHASVEVTAERSFASTGGAIKKIPSFYRL